MQSPAMTAAFLDDLRTGAKQCAGLPDAHMPPDEASAYAAQAELVERLLARLGGRCSGYKIACTNELAQRLLGARGPAAGVMFSALTHPSPAAFKASDFRHRIIEAEFAFRIGADAPAQHYDAGSIAAHVAAVLPAIEIVDHRFAGLDRFNPQSLIADNAIHGAFVHGAESLEWHTPELVDMPVRLRVNGVIKSTGDGSKVLGNPLNALAWLANHLGSRGEMLRAGELVTTGTCLAVYMAAKGDDVVADFGRFGKVRLGFE